MPKLYLSVFNDGTNDLYIKDAEARQEIADIQSAITGAMHYIGVSSTKIEDGDGAAKGPWTIDGTVYIASGTPTTGQKLLQSGDVAIYGELEFVWSATASKWKEFGSTGSLKALAFKDSASGNFTPAGSNAASAVTFTGGQDGDFVTGYNNDAVAPSFSEGAFDEGSLPSFSEGAFDEGSLPSFSEGAFNAGSLPTMTYDSASEKLTFGAGTLPSKAADTFDAGSLPSKAADTFDAGSLPSKAADTFNAGSAATLATAKAVTDIGTGEAAAQTFTGTQGSVTVS